MATTAPHLDRFRVADCKPVFFMCVIGGRGTGKSTVMNHWVRALVGRIPKIIVFSATEPCNKFWSGKAPPNAVFSRLSEAHLLAVLEAQKQSVQPDDPMHKNGLLIVLDDTAFDKGFLNSGVMKQLAMNGRHSNISVMMSVQYVMSCSIELRSQMDYVVLCRTPQSNLRKRLWENYFGVVDSLQEFEALCRKYTSNHSTLVLHCTSTHNDLSKCVYWFRAMANVPKYKFGSKSFRKAMRHARRKRAEGPGNNDEVMTLG